MNIFKSDKALWVVVAVVIAGFLYIGITSKKSNLTYTLSVQEILEEINADTNIVDFQTFKSFAEDGNTVFVDVRAPWDYNLKHYSSAVNMPSQEIINAAYLETMKQYQSQGKTIVLYGAVPQHAAGPWMLLKQAGITNIKRFNGTFDQLMAETIVPATIYNEYPMIDTTVLSKRKSLTPVEKPKPVKKPVIIERVEPSGGGGC